MLAVFTGADLQADGIGDLPCGWTVKSKDGSDMIQPPHPPIAIDSVNYVGEPYAVVIGETLAAAKNGAEVLVAEFEELPAVVDLASAASAPRIHDSAPNNQCYDWELGDKAATDAAFEKAHHVTRLDIVNNRLIPNAIEPRRRARRIRRRRRQLYLAHHVAESASGTLCWRLLSVAPNRACA